MSATTYSPKPYSIYSEDGTTWQFGEQTSFPNRSLAEIYMVEAENRLIAAASAECYYSIDGGHTWTRSNNFSGNLAPTTMAYGNGVIVASANNNGLYTCYSTNLGLNWNLADTTPSVSGGIAYGNGRFISLYADGSGYLYYSLDGKNWTTKTTTNGNTDIVFDEVNQRFVFIYASSTPNIFSIFYTTTDGITVKEVKKTPDRYYGKIDCKNGFFLASTGRNSKQSFVRYSTNLTTWTDTVTVLSSYVSEGAPITHNDKGFLVHNNKDTAYYSTDGINWTQSTFPATDPSGNATRVNSINGLTRRN